MSPVNPDPSLGGSREATKTSLWKSMLSSSSNCEATPRHGHEGYRWHRLQRESPQCRLSVNPAHDRVTVPATDLPSYESVSTKSSEVLLRCRKSEALSPERCPVSGSCTQGCWA